MRSSTGPRKGLRRPAGARKKLRAPAGDGGQRILRRLQLAPVSRAAPAGKNCGGAARCGFARRARAATISRHSAGWRRALSPMQKKVAFTCSRSSRSSTAGVTSGSGPSSMVSATSPRAAAAAGSRVQLRPSQVLRGHRPAAVSSRWLARKAASTQRHADGCAMSASAIAACSSSVARSSSGSGAGRGTEEEGRASLCIRHVH